VWWAVVRVVAVWDWAIFGLVSGSSYLGCGSLCALKQSKQHNQI